jgi:glycosyltransferase involved in cell wall biosynthesis
MAYFFICLYRARQADVVFAQDTVSVGLPAALAAIVLRKKFLVRVPGDYAWEQARQRFDVEDELDLFQTKTYGVTVEFLRYIQRMVVRSAHVVIVPSKYMERIVSLWGVRPVLIYNGIDLPVATQLPHDRLKKFLVVTIARPVPWKGLDGLTRVVAREKGWELKILDGLPRVQAMGWVKSADVFVLNSSYEGLSHALLEVMSLGTPIIATAVGGNPELIEDTIDGLLISPHDDEGLYHALKNIEEDNDAARTRADSACEKVKTFSIEKTIHEVVALLKTL